ncbi:acyl-CoA dehydrogenase family protein [Streptomyces sp. CNQ085]|uniref:acyl-CoA dehydrogenase family protein n=1 Tax=Streptomyces sp. CNQ085 TaxID=2886944 RepID=UPI001F509F7B|nr:acyl-CoA dehydrogenase family protein [Streptomyces sp. CNQ085]MCI0384724.1 acyl-CoA dehydrogenase family protein [Streptomyces sp. CNQ085]
MIGFRLDEEYEVLREGVADFARTAVAPVIGDLYKRDAFPYDLVAEMGRMGLFGLPFAKEYGGQGRDFLALCVALEELARVDTSVAITLSAGVSLGAMPLYRFGSAEQKERWMPQLCAGEALSAFGLTEPGGGTDIASLTTTAVRDGDEWVIDGAKSFITNSGTDITRLVTVTAVTGVRADGRQAASTIVVPSGTPGFEVAPPYSKAGWNSSDTHGLTLTGVRVPAGNLLGQEGRGLSQFLSVLDESRIAISAVGTGIAQGCVDEAVRHAGERVAFGRSIGTNQAIQFMIADMEVRAHSARLAYYHAVTKMLRGEPFGREASIAKLVASGAAMDNARDATQIFGGYGCLNDYPVSRFYRDAKVLEVGEGTNEVQRMLIARSLGLPAAA